MNDAAAPMGPNLRRHPFVRLCIGVSIGFLGAAATITAMDRLDQLSSSGGPSEAVLGAPDFASYCDTSGLTAVQVGVSADRWRCVGRLNGLWTHVPLSADEVCRSQYAVATARVDLDDAARWTCVEPPP